VDIPAFVRAMGTRVFHVHLKDHIGSQSMALGAGQTDNAAVLRALKDVGFEGHLSVEMEVDDRENALRYVQESLPYLTRLMEKTGVA
jgi:sugar phosphate isomerase/epimerase